MTAEHEAAVAALRRNLAAEQGGAESKEDIEIKEETVALTWYDDPFIGSSYGSRRLQSVPTRVREGARPRVRGGGPDAGDDVLPLRADGRLAAGSVFCLRGHRAPCGGRDTEKSEVSRAYPGLTLELGHDLGCFG